MKKCIKGAAGLGILVLILALACLIFIPHVGDAYAKSDERFVYLGGTPIGIAAKADGLIVNDFVDVETESSNFSPAKEAGLLKGDVITEVNGQKVSDVYDLNEIIKNSGGKLSVKAMRGGAEMTFRIQPIPDKNNANALKTGMVVRNDLTGIGTLTFVTEDGHFASLGHKIVDSFGHGEIYSAGKVYECEIKGYIKGKEGKAGELRGSFSYGQGAIGEISANKFCGVYGTLTSFDKQSMRRIPLGVQSEVENGRAQIYTTISGKTPQYYDIEIIKASRQNSPAEKGMVIRITDENLRGTTAGILQGMSGSPIVQNGKLIGAVTHVFISDPTKGYGIYADFMK